MHSSIIAEHEREKESAIIVCVFSSALACVSGYIFVCVSMFLHVYVFTKGCIFVSLSVCAGREWGSVVCLCVNQSIFYFMSVHIEVILDKKTQQKTTYNYYLY